ncbi:duf803 domain-containing protein [Moniliophthora roreri MCA 2997]|uniref:Duf803 domain-containing protein n=2 Tax=Moniliophthora roreri TaxID=221103 RepID=V2X7V6_MONRO|nr:duf803 domain-containing protein [Moniliophthora roreri MCA 2997]
MAETHIALGIIIGLLASFIQSLGLTIQRKSHVLNEKLPIHEQRLEHRRPLWLLGFAIFISSNIIGSLVQIASLPVVILAPLGAVSLLWNAFFARVILGDVFSAWMALGTLFIAGGAVLIAIFGIVPEPTRTLEDLLALFRRSTFVVYFSLLGVFVVISLAVTHLAEYRLSKKLRFTEPSSPTRPSIPTNPPTLTTGITDTVTEAITTERTPLLDRNPKSTENSSRAPSFISTGSTKDALSPQSRRIRLMLAISYASFSGIISGMCLLFAKSGVELLILTIQGDNQFWRWQSWVLLLALVIFALLQLWYLHKGLVFADPTLVCPSAFCFYNLSSIVNGLVYFDQFSLISPLHLCLVALGIVVLLAGVWVVSIQAGGGTVDVSNWNSDAELSEEEASSTPETRTPSDLEAGRERESPTGAEGRPPGTMSEPLMNPPSSSDETHASPRLSNSISSISTRSRSRTQPSRRLPTLDLHYVQPSTSHRHSRIGSHNTPYYNSTYNTHTRPPLSPTLPSVSALAGAGFQIGLSPVSPGFNIVPLERRRRTSTNFGSSMHSGDSTRLSVGRPGASPERRRTVSEGAFGWGTLTSDQEQHESLNTLTGDPGHRNDDTLERWNSGTAGMAVTHDQRGSSRWKWFRKLGLSRK